MCIFLFNAARAERFSLLAALTLTLCVGGLSGCSDTAPTAKAEADRYYLDGKPSTKEAVEKLDPNTIDRVDVLKNKQATDYTHDATTKGVVLVKTKKRSSPM